MKTIEVSLAVSRTVIFQRHLRCLQVSTSILNKTEFPILPCPRCLLQAVSLECPERALLKCASCAEPLALQAEQPLGRKLCAQCQPNVCQCTALQQLGLKSGATEQNTTVNGCQIWNTSQLSRRIWIFGLDGQNCLSKRLQLLVRTQLRELKLICKAHTCRNLTIS